MGVTISQVYNTVYKITERNNKVMHFLPSYYEQEPIDSRNLTKQVAQKSLKHRLQTRLDLEKGNMEKKKV